MDFDSEIISRESETEENNGDADVDSVHYAAAHGDVTILMDAIRKDPSLLEQQDSDGLTPLANAVQSQQMKCVKQLVKVGANINAQDNFGRTCLSIAAYQGWYDGVLFLLRNGAKKTITDKSGRTPLHASTYCIDTRTMDGLLQNLTLEEVNTPDQEKMNALHWAAFHNRPEHVKLLIKKGGNASANDIDGKNPLHWAAQNGSVSCTCALLEHAENRNLLNAVDHTGKSPIHYAAAAGHSDLIMAIAAFDDCDMEIEDPDDRTPLHWAAAMGQHEVVSCLLTLGVKPSPKDTEGGTPMEYAQQSGHVDCVKLLEKAIEQSSSTNCRHAVNSQSSSGKQKGPLGIIIDFFQGSPKNESKELSLKSTFRDEMDIQLDTLQTEQKKNKKGKIPNISPRGLSSSIMPAPLGDIQSNQVKSPRLLLTDGQTALGNTKTADLLTEWRSPSTHGSSHLVKEYPPKLPPLSPSFHQTVDNSQSPPTRSHGLAPLKHIRSPRTLPVTDDVHRCSDSDAVANSTSAMIRSPGKSGNNLSLILTEPVFSNEIIKPKSKRKQVRENNTPPDSPVLNYSKDCPDASEESLLKTSPKRQSTLDHNSLRNDKSVDVDKSPESCQESSFTNDNSYEEQKKNIAQMQTEQCNEELSKTKSILPETLSPRSHQSIALGFYDGKSNSVKNASSSGSHLSEERKNLDKSIYNLLQ
ncbi:hypothetical protein ScPMuIL_006148 [Solemya velum]